VLNVKLLTDLLPLLAAFQQGEDAPNADSVEAFAEWLHKQMVLKKEVNDKHLPQAIHPDRPRGEETPATLGKQVYYMYRYARFYTKKALKDSMLNSLDEFTFLATMTHVPPLTKTELINKMVYDKTSGVEIINRFIKHGLVNEIENPADKRSKLITITDDGRAVMMQSLANLQKVASIIPGNLNGDELMTLIHLLDKLDSHHLSIWTHHKEADLEEIVSLIR
jgi:DNA-binding MarR family transcriptional regulator